MSDKARVLAAKCLIEVDKGGYSNLVFKNKTKGQDYERRDLLFATALFYGTLERRLTLDFILSKYISKPLGKLDVEVLAILRSGLYQSLYMDSVPVSAAVNESAALCSVFKKTSAKGFVNAVLRKSAAFDLNDIESIPDQTTRLSVKYSLDEEIVKMFLLQYGERAKDIMASFFNKSVTAVRVNTLRAATDEIISSLKADGVSAEVCALDGALVIKNGDYLKSRAFSNGDIRIQSLSAQSAIEALLPEAGTMVLDMCAAPGGKTLTAAQIMKNSGEIVALDCYAGRVKLIEEQAALEGVTIVKAVVADATDYDEGTLFDRVLCDVPCSAYGEIGSKPELRYKKPPKDGELTATQAKILANGARHTKVGGRIVYSTCTLNTDENEQTVAAFLRENPSFRAVTPKLSLAFMETDDKFAYFLPNMQNNEGFFIASLERIC